MKKYILLLIAAMFLVACGSSDEEQEETENETGTDSEEFEKEIETISTEDVSIDLAEDNNINIELTKINHGRDSENDFISLHTIITNNQNRSYEMYIKELSVDGQQVNDSNIWLDEDSVDPEGTKGMIINGYDTEQLTIEEHIAGTIVYSDYDDNRYELKFSEYINE